MGMFTRIGDIISANFNELIDKFEDPEKMLKQAVREMESAITQAEHDAAKVLGSEKLLAKELAHNERQAAEWERRAEQAVSATDDVLARKAISRRQEHSKLVIALRDQLQESQQAGQTLRIQLDAMRAKLAEAKRSLATIAARKRVTEFQTALQTLPATNPDADAFSKFARLKEKVEKAEAEAQAFIEIRQQAACGLHVEPTSNNSDVDLELRTLKNKLRA